MSPTNPKNPAPQANRHNAQQDLRTRAVLHEGKLRDRQSKRSKERRIDPPPCELETRPHLAQYLEANGNNPPDTRRGAADRTRHLHVMFEQRGSLVFLRLTLKALDEYELHAPELPRLVRDILDDKLWSLLENDAPYTVDVHRGAEGITHAHLVTPLACFLSYYRQLIDAAPHGIGGGVELPFSAAHGVVMGDTVQDREAVAAYVRCHPDGRLKEHGTPAYLDALEDELMRKQAGQRMGRLGWTVGL